MTPDDLDGDLRRMFAELDDRLDVPVRPDAAETIVSGARRLRRRRVAAVTASGALVVAIVGGGVLLAGSGPQALPPAGTPTETVTSTPPPPSSAVSHRRSVNHTATGDVSSPDTVGQPDVDDDPTTHTSKPPPPVRGRPIGPFGFSGLRLGVSYDKAVATGMVGDGDPPPADGCSQYPLLLAGQDSGHVWISATGGVQMLRPRVRTHTPEGATDDLTIDQVAAIYPDFDRDEASTTGMTTVAAPGNQNAAYRMIFDGGQLSLIALMSATSPCAL